MLRIYKWGMKSANFLLTLLLHKRLSAGKEDGARLHERMGAPQKPRPQGKLIWLHAASVGESQSALILINAILKDNPALNILVTTGTVTSAVHMAKTLPEQAFHQYMPLDHPQWVENFITHWRPDGVLWIESEFWPNMLAAIKTRNIPAALINARLSARSYKRWALIKKDCANVLQVFQIILAQTDEDTARFHALGVEYAQTSGNLKYCATPLPCDDDDLAALKKAIKSRPFCVYASTHAGEEGMALRIHNHLRAEHPDLLSIIIPRHPDRGAEIAELCQDMKATLRGTDKALPDQKTEIYIADTMGELGLFYRAAKIVYIGRSMSDDGGGGHNPIEAAQLGCAVIHGPNIQNLQEIYDDMRDVLIAVETEDQLCSQINMGLNAIMDVEKYVELAMNYTSKKTGTLKTVQKRLQTMMAGAI